MKEEGIQQVLENYSKELLGTKKDIPQYRKLYTSLIQTLPKARNGEEFVVGLLVATVLHDLLRNSIENRYLTNRELIASMRLLPDFITNCATLDWDKIRKSLIEFGDKYRKIPAAQRSGYCVVVDDLKYTVPSLGDQILGVEGEYLEIFFDLDANLSDPKIAPKVLNWYANAVNDLVKDLGKAGKKIHGLFFIEKSFSDLGALALMPYLVEKTKLPASVYRMDYWTQDTKIVGQPLLPDCNYCVIYDVIGKGAAVMEAHAYLEKYYGAAVKGCVAFFEYDDLGGHQALEGKNIQLETYIKLSEIDEKIKSKTQITRKLMEIAKSDSISNTEQFIRVAKKILSESIQ